MPPKSITTKPPKKCIKFGEILIDENRKIFLFCVHCFLDFVDLQQYSQHMKNCKTTQHLFSDQNSNSTKLNCEKGTVLLTRIKKNLKELLIYEIDKGKADGKVSKSKESASLRKIQEELLNPRWYTDLPSKDNNTENAKNKATYNELIEEVTPFVQFKENVKTKPVACNPNHQNRQTQSNPKIKTISTNFTTKPTSTRLQQQQQQRENATENTKVQTNVKNTSPATGTATGTGTLKPILKRKSEPLTMSPDEKKNEEIAKRRKTIVQPIKPNQNQQQIISTKSTSIKSLSNAIEKPIILQKKTITRTMRSDTVNGVQHQHQHQQQQQQQPRKIEQISSPTKNSTLTLAISKKINKTKQSVMQQQQTPSKLQIMTQIHKMPQKILTPESSPQKLVTTVKLENKSVTCPPSGNSNQQTVEILNKLQTLGLKVQRTNPPPPPPLLPKSISSANNEQALEIIKKLQSKGMNVKIVQKHNNNTIQSTPMVEPTSNSGRKIVNGIVTDMSQSAVRRSAPVASSVLAAKPNFRKNVLIKKCN